MKAATCSVSGRRVAMSAIAGLDKNTSDHMPGEGNSTSPTFRKLEPVFEKRSLENLFQAFVDRPHHGHAAENVFAGFNELAPDKIRGEEAEERQRDEREDQTRPGHFYGQIGFRPVGDRNDGTNQVVHPIDEPPGQADGDVEWAHEYEAGEEIVAQTADHAVVKRPVRIRHLRGYRPRLQARRALLKFAHAQLRCDLGTASAYILLTNAPANFLVTPRSPISRDCEAGPHRCPSRPPYGTR